MADSLGIQVTKDSLDRPGLWGELSPRKARHLCVHSVPAKRGTETLTAHSLGSCLTSPAPRTVGRGDPGWDFRAAPSSLPSQELQEAEVRTLGHPGVPTGAGRTGVGERAWPAREGI